MVMPVVLFAFTLWPGVYLVAGDPASAGKWIIVVTADIVRVIALLQYAGLRRQQTGKE